MAKYNMELSDGVLKVSFGDEAANNSEIVKEVQNKAATLKDKLMGTVLKINGPASLPVAFLLSHEFGHIVQAIACFDPKLKKYVVSVSHDPGLAVGDLID